MTTVTTRPLLWADEFDHDGLPDPARWSYDVGGHGWGNQEAQFYTDSRAENARVEDGRLVIEARHEDWQGSAFTSARLISLGKMDWHHGRAEVRAKLPRGRGTWPAIWMLPSTPDRQWPADGEIDVMEHVGWDPGTVHASIHTEAYHHKIKTQRTERTAVADAQDAFHTYWTEWTPTTIITGVDDRSYFAYHREADADHTTWPFDVPFHLILNLAVGGWGGVEGIDETAFPARFEVEFVRIYGPTRP